MEEAFLILEKGFWAGIAALGFGVLFNVPQRTLWAIAWIGALGSFVKFVLLEIDVNIIFASLAGASLVGIVSIPLAHEIHSPPLIFSIPAVIPMVPGALAYQMMIGLMKIAVHTTETGMEVVLTDTFQAAMKATFILLSLAVGVAVPMLVTRKESAKRIRIKI